jgi:DNA-binding FadR family transcriptional regulator
MPIQTIDADRLYRKIARQLSDLIRSGEFAPGQRLPAERDLARQLGVSRPSVREALIALEIEGKVEVRVGAGVFVSARPVDAPPDMDEGEGPFELLGARRVVEGETAAWAARDATAEEIAAIGATVEALAAAAAGDPRADAIDRDFHLAIARATHNDSLAWVVRMLWDQGRGAVWRQMEKHFQTPALRSATIRDHRAVSKAIEAHDAAAARTAMQRHLLRVSHEFQKSVEQDRRQQGKRSPAARRADP